MRVGGPALGQPLIEPPSARLRSSNETVLLFADALVQERILRWQQDVEDMNGHQGWADDDLAVSDESRRSIPMDRTDTSPNPPKRSPTCNPVEIMLCVGAATGQNVFSKFTESHDFKVPALPRLSPSL
ncbi:hypothetical protein CC2G_006644 [Coprinopsis cinerea AmutBmut pab1-1]|nr:hypothetical protein CC2G_006644 [Coprinopsis cinerea AmutBmut pab1-1]